MNQNPMNDRQRLYDSIASQKFITSNYNTFASECVNSNLREDFLNILGEEHRIQADLFSEAQTRGWYQVSASQPQQITQARQKIEQMNQSQSSQPGQTGQSSQSGSVGQQMNQQMNRQS